VEQRAHDLVVVAVEDADPMAGRHVEARADAVLGKPEDEAVRRAELLDAVPLRHQHLKVWRRRPWLGVHVEAQPVREVGEALTRASLHERAPHCRVDLPV